MRHYGRRDSDISRVDRVEKSAHRHTNDETRLRFVGVDQEREVVVVYVKIRSEVACRWDLSRQYLSRNHDAIDVPDEADLSATTRLPSTFSDPAR